MVRRFIGIDVNGNAVPSFEVNNCAEAVSRMG
jgi:hypothetical protein